MPAELKFLYLQKESEQIASAEGSEIWVLPIKPCSEARGCQSAPATLAAMGQGHCIRIRVCGHLWKFRHRMVGPVTKWLPEKEPAMPFTFS